MSCRHGARPPSRAGPRADKFMDQNRSRIRSSQQAFWQVVSSLWCSRISSLGKPSLAKALFEPGDVLRVRMSDHVSEAGDTKFRVKLEQAGRCHLRSVEVTRERVARCDK